MNPRNVPFLALCLLLSLGLLSCAVKVDTVLAADQSARVELQANFHPVLQAYLTDLSGGKQDFFSETSIRKRLVAEKGITVQHLEASMEKGINIGLRIADIRQILVGKDGEVQGAISLTNEGGKKRLAFRLNRKTIEAFLAMSGNSAEMKYLLPQDGSLTAKQYQDQLNWALEEYGTASQMADMFKTSTIKLKLTVPAPIVSATGFTIIDRQAGIVGLDLNLVELLTLSSMVINEVRF